MPTKEHQKQFKVKGRELTNFYKISNFNLETKPLPLPRGKRVPDEEFVHEFSRNDLRELIHLITEELKMKGTKTPHVFLAFRSKLKMNVLTHFLEHTLISGKKPASTAIMKKFVRESDEFTLVAALKYLWARLPDGCIIGWDAYDLFKDLEKRESYPKRAFLEFMPQCLSSPSHASIVYDFLDLIVSMAGNAKDNMMSGRKLAKMCAIWAFHGPPNSAKLPNSKLDPTENSFTKGLKNWIPAANAMFHLLLSFLRSMLPDDYTITLQLTRNLQTLLASNSYPPSDLTSPSNHMIEVPLVTIRTNCLSNSPLEMLNRVPKVLTFENPDLFEAKEDYTLLKAFCQNDGNILSRLSSESRKVLELISSTKSDNALKAGWPTYNRPVEEKVLKETVVAVSRVSIEDYFVWAWSASISFEQTISNKRVFGRSLIQEVAFDGYRKTIIIEEQNTYSHVRDNQPPLRDVSSERDNQPPLPDVSSERDNQPPLPDVPRERDTTRIVSQPNYKSMIDEIPGLEGKELPSKPKKKKLKTKASQESNQQNFKNNVLCNSPKLSNFLKKTHFKHGLMAPALPLKDLSLPDSHFEKTTYEPVELPEIEKGQYRLSIPLSEFGFDDDQQQVSQNQSSHHLQKEQQNQLSCDNNQKEKYQYQSLAPPSSSSEPYQYWSTKEPETKSSNIYTPARSPYQSPSSTERSGKATTGIPVRSDQSPPSALDTEIPLLGSSYDLYNPLQSPVREPGCRNSVENLSNMVNEMTVQVNEAVKKLCKDNLRNCLPSRPIYDFENSKNQGTRRERYVSLDPIPAQNHESKLEVRPRSYQSHQELKPQRQQESVADQSYEFQQKNPQIRSMYELDTLEDQKNRPISYISTYSGYASSKQQSERYSEIRDTVPDQQSSKHSQRPMISPILITERLESKMGRKPSSAAHAEEEVKGEKEDNSEECIDGSPSNLPSNPLGTSSNVRTSVLASASFINDSLANVSSRNNYESSDHLPLDRFEVISTMSNVDTKRETVFSNVTGSDNSNTTVTNEDSYIGYKAVGGEGKKHSGKSQNYSYSIIDNYRNSSVSGGPTSISARGNFPRDNLTSSRSFSTTDVNFISESSAHDDEITLPDVPKSPVRKRKPVSASPEKQLQENQQAQPLPKFLYQESGDDLSSKYQTAASSDYENYQTTLLSEGDVNDRYRQHSSAQSTSQYQEEPTPAAKQPPSQNRAHSQSSYQTSSVTPAYGYQQPQHGHQRQSQQISQAHSSQSKAPLPQQHPPQNYPQSQQQYLDQSYSSQKIPQAPIHYQQQPYIEQALAHHQQPYYGQPEFQQCSDQTQFIPNKQRRPQAPVNRNAIAPNRGPPDSEPSSVPGPQRQSQSSQYIKAQQPRINSAITPQDQEGSAPNSRGSRQLLPYRLGQPPSSHCSSNGSRPSLQVSPQSYSYNGVSVSSQEFRGRSPQNQGHRRTHSPSANSISSRGRSQQAPQQQYGHPSQAYYLPPQQGYYPPQGYYYSPAQGYQQPLFQGGHPVYLTSVSDNSFKGFKKASDMAMKNVPAMASMNKLHHNSKVNKKNMRAELIQGDFGI